MAKKKTSLRDRPIIPCHLTDETRKAVDDFAGVLRAAAPEIGFHGLDQAEFRRSGLFEAAIERIRGQQAAKMDEKRRFIATVLDNMKDRGLIAGWKISGTADRHDYEVTMPNGSVTAIEAKGCLDGNNTTIYERPPQAEQFLIWSLCQNSGADPRKNAWSGVHVRLSAQIIHTGIRVDGLIVWDMVCGSLGRPCPKIQADAQRATELSDYRVPPPCIYLFPRTVPDPRNNPKPAAWKLDKVPFLSALHAAFHGDENDVTEVQITAGMEGATVTRITRLVRAGNEIIESAPTPVRRAKG